MENEPNQAIKFAPYGRRTLASSRRLWRALEATMNTKHDIDLLLNAQRGLLGEIPPSLRAASFDLSADGQDLVARFEFDGEPIEEELECARVAMTNVLANYSSNHRSYHEEMVSVPFPQKLRLLRLVVFHRNEDEWNPWGKASNK